MLQHCCCCRVRALLLTLLGLLLSVLPRQDEMSWRRSTEIASQCQARTYILRGRPSLRHQMACWRAEINYKSRMHEKGTTRPFTEWRGNAKASHLVLQTSGARHAQTPVKHTRTASTTPHTGESRSEPHSVFSAHNHCAFKMQRHVAQEKLSMAVFIIAWLPCVLESSSRGHRGMV